MRIELEVAGYAVHFVSINKDNAIDSQEEIVKRCAFPQLQDTVELGLWGRFDGHKDDFYILDAEGKLRTYLPFTGGAIKTVLSVEADYQAVKAAILDVLEPREPGPEDLDVMGLEEGQSSGEKKIAGSASPDMAKGGGEYLYRLGAGDKLRVNVFGEKDLSGEFQVSAAGEVSLPLIGSVSAGGLTLEGFNKLVGIRLRDGYLKQPKVSAEITNYRPVYVLGEVRSPGPYEYINRMTVLQAVALAGGYTYRANERKIKIDRRIRVLGLTGKAGSDTRLLPGDVVHIPERFF